MTTPAVIERNAHQVRQLAELARLTGRSEEDIACEFMSQRLSWTEFYKAKVWEMGKR